MCNMTNMKKYLVYMLSRQLDRCKMKNKENNKANSRTATMEGQIVFVQSFYLCVAIQRKMDKMAW